MKRLMHKISKSLLQSNLFILSILQLLFVSAGNAIASEYSISPVVKKINIFASITSRSDHSDSILHEPVSNVFLCEDPSISRGYSITTTNIMNSCGSTENSIQLQYYSDDDEQWTDYNYHTSRNFCITEYRSWPLWSRMSETGIYDDSGSGGDVMQSRNWYSVTNISTVWIYEVEANPVITGKMKSATVTGEFSFDPGGAITVNGLMPSIMDVKCSDPYEAVEPCGACFSSTYFYSAGKCRGKMEWDITSQVLSSGNEIEIRFEGSGNEIIVNDVRECDAQPRWRNERRGWSINANEGPHLVLLYEMESCQIQLSTSPTEVMPQKTGGNTDAIVTVSWSKETPPEGCTVNLEVEPADNSEGHSHGGSRPKGTMNPNSVTIPGGITAGSIPAGTYRSAEVSGDEKIIAKVHGEKMEEATVRIKVPGLLELGNGDGYRLIGETSTHPYNHFGTENTLLSLLDLAAAFNESGKDTLKINDISLIWGGLFDINANWASPHKSHRAGRNVDVGSSTVEGERVTKRFIDKIMADLEYAATVLDEGNHLHLSFP